MSVGNELLFGQTVDTNAAWLGRTLSSLGVPVVRRYTVGDRMEAISGALHAAMEGNALVVLTGGLGPTTDDVTREAVAETLGRELHFDAERLERLAERFRSRGYGELPETNRRQAHIPEGARVLENRHGTAPGLALEEGHCLVVLLPGVPREMRGIFTEEAVPLLRERLGEALVPVTHRLLHTTGVPESRLAELIEAAFPEPAARLGDRVTIAFLPDLKGVDLRLSIVDADGDAARAELDRVEALLAPIIEPWRFRSASGDAAEAVLDALRSASATLAVAESCTAGMVASRLTDHAGSSDVFVGGVVAYANEVKAGLLGVPEEELSAHGAVSEVVARRMAEGVLEAASADFGLAITGVAGPGGGSEEKPVGTVWLAVAGPHGTRSEHARFVGDRAAVRERAAQAGLALVLRVLEARDDRA